jgi:hypothetical protein
MTNRNLFRRLKKLEKQIVLNEVRHVIRVLYMNKGNAAPSGTYLVDPWAKREQERVRDKTPASPKNRGR